MAAGPDGQSSGPDGLRQVYASSACRDDRRIKRVARELSRLVPVAAGTSGGCSAATGIPDVSAL
jgi:hypothetical protein